MDEHDHIRAGANVVPRPLSFLRSRAGKSLVVALVVGGLLLGYAHRAYVFGSDWLLWLPLLLCVGMHFFMHGGHGGHGGKNGGSGQP